MPRFGQKWKSPIKVKYIDLFSLTKTTYGEEARNPFEIRKFHQTFIAKRTSSFPIDCIDTFGGKAAMETQINLSYTKHKMKSMSEPSNHKKIQHIFL
jgi:hypothetical protein